MTPDAHSALELSASGWIGFALVHVVYVLLLLAVFMPNRLIQLHKAYCRLVHPQLCAKWSRAAVVVGSTALE